MAEAIERIGKHVVDRIAAELVRVEHFHTGAVISTPILYPSGSHVAVQVREAGSRFFVSDIGMGFVEADMMGASITFRKEAKRIAEIAGIRFDDNAFFEIDVPRENLVAAIAIVGNASSEATIITAYKLAIDELEEQQEAVADILYHKLSSIFTPLKVTRRATLYGESNTEWPITALVKEDDRQAIFEPVKRHANSVYAVHTKFDDISRLVNAPRRVAVVRNIPAMNTFIGILSQSASVVEFEASPEAFKKLAA